MKSLASCKPSEFLVQTNKIRKSVEKWLTDTDIMNIRKRQPEYEVAKPGASAEERKALVERNAKKEREQAKANLSAMLDAIMDAHPQETLEVLALCAFVEPENVDDYPIGEYLKVFTDLINNENVMDFFTSLMRLARMNTTDISKA